MCNSGVIQVKLDGSIGQIIHYRYEIIDFSVPYILRRTPLLLLWEPLQRNHDFTFISTSFDSSPSAEIFTVIFPGSYPALMIASALPS